MLYRTNTHTGLPATASIYFAVTQLARRTQRRLYGLLVRRAFGHLCGGISPLVKVGNPQFVFIYGASIQEYTWIYAVTDDCGQTNVFRPRIEIQEGCSIGRFCQITCSNKIVFEKSVFLSEGILVTDSVHGYRDIENPVLHQTLISLGPVIIGEGSWIGSGARLVGRVSIGRNAVVAANAVVVNKVVPPYTMVAGVPARVIKAYNPDRREWVPVSQELTPA